MKLISLKDKDDPTNHNNKLCTFFTSWMLFFLLLQLLLFIGGSIFTFISLAHLIQFQYINYGWTLKIVEIIAIYSLLFGFTLTLYQISSTLSMKYVFVFKINNTWWKKINKFSDTSDFLNHGFIVPGILGIIVAFQLITVGAVMIGLNENWRYPIDNNFKILMKASSINPAAGEVQLFLKIKYMWINL